MVPWASRNFLGWKKQILRKHWKLDGKRLNEKYYAQKMFPQAAAKYKKSNIWGWSNVHDKYIEGKKKQKLSFYIHIGHLY